MDLSLDGKNAEIAPKSDIVRYQTWGGYPAAVAGLDGFEAAKANDAELAAIFHKLDQLDRAPRTVDGLIQTFVECKFTPQEVSRINSPVLDGLCKAVCGREPDGITMRLDDTDRPTSPVCFALRLLFPIAYPAAFRWVAACGTHDDALGVDQIHTASRERPAMAQSLPNGLFSPPVLMLAITKGDVELVSIIMSGMSPVQMDVCKAKAIDLAIRRGRVHILTVLLPLISRTDTSTTPTSACVVDWFTAALVANQPSCLRLLLDHFSLAPAEMTQHLPGLLETAACRGQPECLRSLLQECQAMLSLPILTRMLDKCCASCSGAAVLLLYDAIVTAGGSTELPHAVLRRILELADLEVLQTLAPVIQAPCNPLSKERYRRQIQETAWTTASQNRSAALIALLEQLNLLDHSAPPPGALLEAVRYSNMPLLSMVLQRMPSQPIPSVVWFFAACDGSEPLLEALLDHTARINADQAMELRTLWQSQGCVAILNAFSDPMPDTITLLSGWVTACENGQMPVIEAVERLRATRADLDVERSYSTCAVWGAVESQHAAVVHHLMIAGWLTDLQLVDIPDLMGEAVETGNLEITSLLIASGIGTSVWLSTEQTRLSTYTTMLTAAATRHQQLCELLLPLLDRCCTFTPPLNAALRSACAKGEFEWLVVRLLEHMYEHDDFTHRSMRLSDWASLFFGAPTDAVCGALRADRIDIDMVKLLLDCGAEPGAYSSIAEARKHGRTAIAELLVSRRLPSSST